MYKRLAVLVLVAMLGTAFAAPEDNTLVVGTSQEPVLVMADPLRVVTNTVIMVEVDGYTRAELFRMTIDSVLEGNQATEVPTVENGRLVISDRDDGSQAIDMHITLRDDLRWSDGEPLTSDDFLFTWEIVQAPGMPLLGPDFWARFSMEVVDDQNFIITLSPAQASDLVLTNPITALPRHVMGDSWAAAQSAAAAFDPATDAVRLTEIYRAFFTEFGSPAAVNAGRMVYSGPFMPTRWTAGSALEMARNPHYHSHPSNQDAYVRSVTYRFINDTNALLFAIVSGAVDATSSVSITFDQGLSPQLLARDGERYEIWFVPQPTWEHLEVNQFRTVQEAADLMLYDKRTRQALTMALDRQGMTDALFGGLQPVAHANVPPADPTYNPNVRQYPHDPEAARALFAELGWTAGADGILTRTTDDGRLVRFELEFVTTAGNAARERAQQFFAEDLRQVGVDVRINNAPSNVVFANDFINRASDGSYTGVFMFAYSSSQSATLNQASYLCRNAPRAENNYTGQNSGGACSEEYDALRDVAVVTLDRAEALPMYHRMQEIFAEDVMAISLIYRSQPYVVTRGLVNYVTSTFSTGAGYPPARPEFVGWERNGPEQFFSWEDYASRAQR